MSNEPAEDSAAVAPSPIDARTLLTLTQSLLKEFPLGLMVLDAAGRPFWHNDEADLACAAWNQAKKGADFLPIEKAGFRLPEPLWAACQALLQSKNGKLLRGRSDVVADHDRGLLAHVRLETVSKAPVFLIRIDYRRPRTDRERPVSPEALSLLNRLTPREREVALRLREGLSTAAISAALCRSEMTIKSQLKSLYRKLGASNRARAAALLNR